MVGFLNLVSSPGLLSRSRLGLAKTRFGQVGDQLREGFIQKKKVVNFHN